MRKEVMECCIRILSLLAIVNILGCRSLEVSYGKSSLDPHPIDSDGDLLTDFEEKVFTGTDLQKADTDGDGLPDGWEWFSGLDPLCADDNDGSNGDPYTEGINGTIFLRILSGLPPFGNTPLAFCSIHYIVSLCHIFYAILLLPTFFTL